MNDSPTLDELRARVQKERHREIGNWLARRVARPLAIYGTWLAVRLGLSAHQITVGALIANLLAAVALGTGERWGLVLCALLLHLGFWLDHVDGQVARWRGTAGLTGVYFDYLMHHVSGMAVGFALGYGLAARTGVLAWALAGFLIATGWTLLGLNNDCRYKAFFQRLKASQREYRVKGGSGDRPAPAPGWPKRGLGMLSWPLFKLCEPHVVLMSLTILAVIACFPGHAWSWAWQAYAGSLAFLSPGLALLRLTRTIQRDRPSSEFERWFQVVDPD